MGEGWVVMLLKSSFKGEVVGKWIWGPDQIWQELQKNVIIVKSPWIPLHCHWSLWIATVLKKFLYGLSGLQVSCEWRFVVSSWFDEGYSFPVFCHDVFTSFPKVIMLMTILPCFRDNRTGFFCLIFLVTRKIPVFLMKKKTKCILHMTKIDHLLKNMITWWPLTRSEQIHYFLKLIPDGEKNREAVMLLILGLLLGKLYCFKITFLGLQILTIQMLVFHLCLIFIKFVTLWRSCWNSVHDVGAGRDLREENEPQEGQ